MSPWDPGTGKAGLSLARASRETISTTPLKWHRGDTQLSLKVRTSPDGRNRKKGSGQPSPEIYVWRASLTITLARTVVSHFPTKCWFLGYRGVQTFLRSRTVIGSRAKLGLFTPLGGVGNLEALHPNVIAFLFLKFATLHKVFSFVSLACRVAHILHLAWSLHFIL
jgi:hypothetical protein